MAGYPFQHVQALMSGAIPIAGCEYRFTVDQIGNLNRHVFSGAQTLDVTEIGLAPYMLAFANEGFRAYTLIPLFPLRMFRHKSIFVHADAGIESPGDLKGRRVGTPGYSTTSLTWIRGMLKDEYGVGPEDVEWVIAAGDSSAANSGTASAQEQVFPRRADTQRGTGRQGRVGPVGGSRRRRTISCSGTPCVCSRKSKG